jgi:CheY-like chemotaxis protein
MSVPNRTVLVVDDNEDALELMSDLLRECEVDVLRARSGPDAMSVLMSQPVDLVLLDIMMPDMNGFAVLEMIRFVPRLTGTTVLVCTARTDQHDVARARELGAVDVLPKPISAPDLRDQVRQRLTENGR